MKLPTNYSLINRICISVYMCEKNNWYYIGAVTQQYLKPFNCMETND